MKTMLRAGLLLGLSSLAFAGHAQEADSTVASETRPYLSVLYSYTFENSDRVGVEEGQGAQLGVGKALSEHWGFELNGFYSEFPHDNTPGANAQREYGGKLDGLYFFSRNPKFSPYFGAGVGGVTTELRGTSLDTTDPFADVGLGFIKYFTLAGADLGFRADLRYRHIWFDDNALGGTNVGDLGEAVLKVGLVVPLGSRAVAAAAPTPPAACMDSDGDGICDTADLCPGTPSGTVVDAKGCPKATAEGANRKFDDVHFEFDKSELAEGEKSKLDKAATTIDGMSKTYPNLKVDVSGHTDWIGTDGYNQGLSERRANTVKSYLSRKGVDAGRINTFAYGESKPIATNETAEGRAQNRRAEIQTHE
ncbi:MULTISPECIES: OmpA family protein [Hydrocarboniphaga]|jgi:OOP family OmpA-OmpF porin|nr:MULTISPECIES: OmpA family protein [Hydrocarboniphaga]MDZ4079388.1 OmpA family protein [Hydrocarboniphaga sp.]|eukprot:TRINITY_DN93397_c0_g1_i1.p2 TRINITY_DN93397_c0_g1~~TRINITY_DN93397_c0_g1_i1.p2  ORF type:complete len:364 (-),score=55.53 TRINITY_DN93397_c0_g1_i1:34-1125(-)